MPRLGTLTSFKLSGIAVKPPRIKALIDEVTQIKRVLPSGITANSAITILNPISAKFNGSSTASIVIPISLTTPITVECYMYATSIPMNGSAAPWGLTSNADGTGSYMGFQQANNSQITTESSQAAFGSGIEFLNTWVHLAMVIKQNDYRLYLDGNLVRSTTWAFPPSYSGFNSIVLGRLRSDNSSTFNGYLDEIRISSGERYNSNFSVPTSPYVVDANTLGLYRVIDYQP